LIVKILSHKFRLLIVSLMIALPLAGITQAVAQEQVFTPEAYTSSLSGYEIAVRGPEFEITSAVLEHYSNGEGEIVEIEGELATLEVSFFDDADTPDESIDAYLAGLENADVDHSVVDRGVTGDTSFAIVSINYEGLEVLYYVQVTGDVTGNVDLFESILSTATTFEIDLQAAQDEVTIDGAAFMVDVDPASIVAVAEDAGSDPSTANPGVDNTATTVTFPNAAIDLSIGGDFEPQAQPVTEGSIEGFVVTGPESANIVAIGQTQRTAAEIVLEFSEGMATSYQDVQRVDAQDDGDTAWSLFTVLSGGEPRVVFVHADTTLVPGYELLVAIEMPQNDVAGRIEAVQAGLMVDGQPLLADVDSIEISALVEDTVAVETPDVSESADETPAVTEEAQSGSDSRREDARLPSGSGSGNSSETSTTEETVATPDATEDPQANGTSWQGPLLGHEVQWDGAVWFTDLEDPDLVISDETEQYESIALVTEISAVSTILYIDIYGQNDATPAEYLAYWTSDDYLMRETSTGEPWNAQLVGTRSSDGRVAVVVSYTSDGEEYLMVREAIATDDGGIMLLTLDAPAADISDAFAASQDGVTIDGQPVFGVFTQEQIDQLSAS
jgi:hypothetical protein